MIDVQSIMITAAENGGFVLRIERTSSPHTTLVAADRQQLDKIVASIQWTNADAPIRAGGA